MNQLAPHSRIGEFYAPFTWQPVLSSSAMGRDDSKRKLCGQKSTSTEGREFGSFAQATIKKHLANIYGKLQVHRRMEAVVRARDLGILH